MKSLIATFVVTSALWLTACHAGSMSSEARTADTQAPAPTRASPIHPAAATSVAPDPASLLAGKLDKGMAYSEFRKLALDHGWRPKPDARCPANVVGGDYGTWCPANPNDAMCKVCDEVPELSSCSGDGHCLMHFAHKGTDKVLAVGTYGEISRWNAPAGKSGLMVTGWQYDAPKAH